MVDLTLIDFDEMENKQPTKKAKKATRKGGKFSDVELKRFAQMVIEDRIRFCEDKKFSDPTIDVDKCVCEAIERWIRLFTDRPLEGSKMLGALRVDAVREMFEELKRIGKIKCSG